MWGIIFCNHILELFCVLDESIYGGMINHSIFMAVPWHIYRSVIALWRRNDGVSIALPLRFHRTAIQYLSLCDGNVIVAP